MRLVPVLLVFFLVSADARFSLRNFFGKIQEKIKNVDLASVAQKIGDKVVSNLPSKIKDILPLNPDWTKTSESSDKSSSPKFCGKYDCPRFYEEKINSTDYKLRCYPEAYKWVSTQVEGMGKRDAFMRLFKYITGNNEARRKINMTVPVAMHMKSGSQTFSYQSMSFFIPFKHQRDAPIPNAENVHLEVIKPFCAYVRAYGGYSTLSKTKENYQSLAAALERDGLGDDFSSDGIYYAGYSDPMKFFNRHNEIWLVSKSRSPSANVTIPGSSAEPTPVKSDKPSTPKSPSFCDGHDCPRFYEKKLNTTNYKLRCYPSPYKWVSTRVTNMNSKLAGTTAFWRLFNYIQGSNAKRMKIDMTVPVTMKMQPLQSGSDSFCKEDYTMSFFIPYKHQTDAPAPSEDDVMLTNVEPFCAYVKVYGGHSDIKKVETNYKELVAALNRDGHGEDFHTNVFYTAGYDSPYKMFNRHNEIWLILKKNKSVNDLLQRRILTQ